MRASDADRTAVAQRLKGAVDEGRLGLGDYDERLQQAYAARTYAELDRVTADLPAPVPAPPVVARAPAQLSEVRDQWRTWLGAAILMTAIWGITAVASGAVNGFWPGIPLGIWAVILLVSTVNGMTGHRRSGSTD